MDVAVGLGLLYGVSKILGVGENVQIAAFYWFAVCRCVIMSLCPT